MISAELVLAAVAGADLALQYGKRLVEAYQAFKEANDNVKTKILIVEEIWSRTAIQIEFVKRVASTLEYEHCRIHIEVFEMLKGKLMMAITKIESVVKKSKPEKTPKIWIKRWKYLLIRETLEHTISELQQWQRIFDPTWFLILRIGNKLIDSELSNTSLSTIVPRSSSSSSTLLAAQKLRGILTSQSSVDTHIFLPEDGLDWTSGSLIKYSTTRTIQRTGSQKRFIFDSIICDASIDVPCARADAETLAKKLKQVDPGTFSLLSCHGLIKRKNRGTGHLASIEVIFRLPTQQAQPTSLRHQFLQHSTFSLTRVLSIARQLAKAVSFVHTCEFVHKNIRPETILVFPEPDSAFPSALGSAYLLGFDSFRSLNFRTLRSGDAAWERNLYRHPLRQGLWAHDDYVMQHDVYSLGVCLLELGLWETFVCYEGDEYSDPDCKKVPSATLGLTLDAFDCNAKESLQKAVKIKEQLVDIAGSRLPARMGDRYTEVVITCLTCLDAGNEDFGDEEDMRDEDGILIGIRFIEKVLFRLSEISF
ncbi:hypothetical protein F5Y19DRAFT_145087 [Xylariaceae sp. FL1651]|nr:hypothetical protein F5Y19DRAFT_145087 [Xylariaceae sp. FL1651]